MIQQHANVWRSCHNAPFPKMLLRAIMPSPNPPQAEVENNSKRNVTFGQNIVESTQTHKIPEMLFRKKEILWQTKFSVKPDVGPIRFQQFVVDRVLRLRRNTHWQDCASFDSLLSRAGSEHLGKGWIVRGTTTRRQPYWANRLVYPSWNRLYRFIANQQQCCRLPSTDLTICQYAYTVQLLSGGNGRPNNFCYRAKIAHNSTFVQYVLFLCKEISLCKVILRNYQQLLTCEPRSSPESTSDYVVVVLLFLLFWSHSLKLALQLAGNGLHLQPCFKRYLEHKLSNLADIFTSDSHGTFVKATIELILLAEFSAVLWFVK